MPFICTDNSLSHGLCDFALFLSLNSTDWLLIMLLHLCSCHLVHLPFPSALLSCQSWSFTHSALFWWFLRDQNLLTGFPKQLHILCMTASTSAQFSSPSIPTYTLTSRSLMTPVTQLPPWSSSTDSSLFEFITCLIKAVCQLQHL